MSISSQKRMGGLGLALVMGLLMGCGGGGGGSSASAGNNNPTPVQGVATPSSVSVVTAQNADAGG
jgi:hypothetical protein